MKKKAKTLSEFKIWVQEQSEKASVGQAEVDNILFIPPKELLSEWLLEELEKYPVVQAEFVERRPIPKLVAASELE